MALRKKVGDVFVVPIDEAHKKYFQYLGVDTIELGGHLIRVFRKKYPLNMELNPRDVIDDEVDFHAHVILQFGVKDGTWQKVGNVKEIKQVDVVFKTDSFVDTSSIWHIPYPERGKEDKKIDALAEEQKKTTQTGVSGVQMINNSRLLEN